MGAWRERKHHFSLSIAKMNVIIIRRDRLINIDLIGIDQKMMMAGQRFHDAGRRDAHAAQAKLDGEALRHANAVERIMKIHFRSFRRRGASLAAAGAAASWRRHGHDPAPKPPWRSIPA